jgi:hypothetical protein
MINLDYLFWIYSCWRFALLSGLGGFYMMMYFDHGMYMLEIYDLYPM